MPMNTEQALKHWASKLQKNRFPRASVGIVYVKDGSIIGDEYEIPGTDEDRAALAAELLALAAEHGPGVIQGIDEEGELLGNGHRIEPPADAEQPATLTHNARAREGLAPWMDPGGVAVRPTVEGLQGAAIVLGLAEQSIRLHEEHSARQERIDRYFIEAMEQKDAAISELQATVVEQHERLAVAEAKVNSGEVQIWIDGIKEIAPKLGPVMDGINGIMGALSRGIGTWVADRLPQLPQTKP